jgi:hypothetical protein
MTQEFLERTDTAGNIVYTTKTGEKINMEPVETKNKDVVATMTFPAEQFIEMFKDTDAVSEALKNTRIINSSAASDSAKQKA